MGQDSAAQFLEPHYIEPDEKVNPVTAEILEAFAPMPDQGISG